MDLEKQDEGVKQASIYWLKNVSIQLLAIKDMCQFTCGSPNIETSRSLNKSGNSQPGSLWMCFKVGSKGLEME